MRCTLYRPQYVWPVDGLECIEYVGDPADVAGDEVAGEQVERGDLNTGDLLYIPRGFSFSASTNGEPSLQLLAAVRPLYWVDVLKAALELTCLECEELRGAIHPRLHAADPEVRELAVETLSRMFENAVRKTRPGDVFDFLDRSHALGSRLPADGHFRNMVDIDCISPESTVARREGVHCLVERSDDWAVMRFAGSEVRASLITLEAMDYIKRAHLFRVKDLPGGLSSNAKVVLVRRLVREGLLQVKGSHAR